MGNKANMQEELQYYTTVEYKKYGKCSVYSSNKFAHSFIIKIIYKFPQTQNHAQQMELFAKVQNMQNLYLIGMYGYKLGKNCHCPSLRSLGTLPALTIEDSSVNEQEPQSDSQNCQKLISSHFLTAYWEYLAFSLKDILTQRRKLMLPFQQSQIWHIVKACSHGYLAFQRNWISFEFKPSNIMVNQDGRVRLDWMEIQLKNTHTALHKKLNKINKFSEYESECGSSEQLSIDYVLLNEEYLSPEELMLLRQKQLTNKINHEKTNIFALGMTILQCMTLKDPMLYYNTINFTIAYENIFTAINYLQRYSYELIQLVKWMLAWQSKHRPDFQIIREKYKKFMRPDNCIQNSRENSFIHKANLKSIKDDLKEQNKKISISQVRRSEVMMFGHTSPAMRDQKNQNYREYKEFVYPRR